MHLRENEYQIITNGGAKKKIVFFTPPFLFCFIISSFCIHLYFAFSVTQKIMQIAFEMPQVILVR